MGGRVDIVVLEDNSCITKDEVNRPVDIALEIELHAILREEGVLVGFEAAVVER